MFEFFIFSQQLKPEFQSHWSLSSFKKWIILLWKRWWWLKVSVDYQWIRNIFTNVVVSLLTEK